MKHEKIFSSRSLLALVVLSSLIFSACGGSESASNRSNVELAETQPVAYSPIYQNANTANASRSADMEVDDSASGERYAEIDGKSFSRSRPRSAFHFLDRCRYRLVRQRPPLT